jgi:hypothetical protein
MIPLLREERESSQAIGALLVKLSAAAYYIVEHIIRVR